MSLLPPIDCYFPFKEDAYEYLQGTAKQNGYAIRIKHSNLKSNQIDYACDREGVHESKSTNKRKTKSKKTGCQFKVTLKKTADYQWRISVKNGLHNHPPSLNPNLHSVHRTLTKEDKEFIEQQYDNGRKRLQILHDLNQKKGNGEGNALVYKDIDNAIMKIKMDRQTKVVAVAESVATV